MQLIKRLMELNPELKAKDVELVVKVILDAMCGRLAKGGRIEIRGFGSFSLGPVQARQKRNSAGGPRNKVPKKYVPQFKAAKELKARVDGEEVKEEVNALSLPTISGQLSAVVIQPAQFPHMAFREAA
ncbi:MAG TPA: HU family DNA-binding protein [Gallionella sp.]